MGSYSLDMDYHHGFVNPRGFVPHVEVCASGFRRAGESVYTKVFLSLMIVGTLFLVRSESTLESHIPERRQNPKNQKITLMIFNLVVIFGGLLTWDF